VSDVARKTARETTRHTSAARDEEEVAPRFPLLSQSFGRVLQSTDANRLIIVVHPDDAAKYDVNLFEVRDYLVRSLDV
jgi:hypothetical protein